MKPTDIFDIATWGELAFHPTAPQLYFSQRRMNRITNRAETHIRQMDTASLSHQRLTAGADDSHPKPSPDGRLLAFLSRRTQSRQVWILPLGGGEAWRLTGIGGGVSDCSWDPGSSGMMVVAHIERGLLVADRPVEEPGAGAADEIWDQWYNQDVKHITHQSYKLDGTGFLDEGRDQLVWVDLQGRPTLITSGYNNYSEPLFSPDGTVVYALMRAYDPEREPRGVTRVVCFSRDQGNWHCETLSIDGLAISSLAISPDGRFLSFHGVNPEEHGYGNAVLYRWDVVGQRLDDLSSGLDRPVGDESSSDVPIASAARPTWRGHDICTLVSDQGRVSVMAFGDSDPELVGPGDRVVVDFAQSGELLALAVSDPIHPSGIVLRDAQGERTVWAPAPWDDGTGPLSPREFWAESPDGTRVQGWCLLPSTAQEVYPGLLEIHGGPMAMYGVRYSHEFQCLAAAGYAVIYSNPRGSVGFGKEFCAVIMGRWGDKDYRDVMAALDHAVSHFPLDRDRLGVLGGSYGGFLVNWIVSHSDRFKAAVAMRSVVNRFSAMGSSDVGPMRVSQYSAGPWWEDPAPYWQQSPLKYVSHIHTPLMIEHQEQDQRLPVEQGEQLYNALKLLGRPVEMVLYPNESHGMSRSGRPWHRVHRLKSLIHWFDRYLGAGEPSTPQ